MLGYTPEIIKQLHELQTSVQESQTQLGDVINKTIEEVRNTSRRFSEKNTAIGKRQTSKEECQKILDEIKDCQNRLTVIKMQHKDLTDGFCRDMADKCEESYLYLPSDMCNPIKDLTKYVTGIQKSVPDALQKTSDMLSLHANHIENSMNASSVSAVRIAQIQESLKNDLTRCMSVLENTRANTIFARTTNKEQIEKDNKIWIEFEKENSKRYQGLPVMYHASPIGTAYQILDSKQITSSVDRLGYATSYDAEGSISVTTPESVFTSLSYLRSDPSPHIPNGVMFAINMKPEEKEGAKHMIAGNISFEEKGRLIGIITDRENIEDIKTTFPEYKDIVYTPDEFCNTVLHQMELDTRINDLLEITLANGKTAQILKMEEHDDGLYRSLKADVLIDGEQYHVVNDGLKSECEPCYMEVTKTDSRQSLKLSGLIDEDHKPLYDGNADKVKQTIAGLCDRFFKFGATKSYIETDEHDIHIDGAVYITINDKERNAIYEKIADKSDMLQDKKAGRSVIDQLADTFISSLRNNSTTPAKTSEDFNHEAAEIYYDMMLAAHDSWVVNNIDSITNKDVQEEFYKFAPAEGIPIARLKDEDKCVRLFLENLTLDSYTAEDFVARVFSLEYKDRANIFKENQKNYKSCSKDEIAVSLKEYYSDLGVTDKIPNELIEKIARQSLEQIKETNRDMSR